MREKRVAQPPSRPAAVMAKRNRATRCGGATVLRLTAAHRLLGAGHVDQEHAAARNRLHDGALGMVNSPLLPEQLREAGLARSRPQQHTCRASRICGSEKVHEVGSSLADLHTGDMENSVRLEAAQGLQATFQRGCSVDHVKRVEANSSPVCGGRGIAQRQVAEAADAPSRNAFQMQLAFELHSLRKVPRPGLRRVDPSAVTAGELFASPEHPNAVESSARKLAFEAAVACARACRRVGDGKALGSDVAVFLRHECGIRLA
mmetsp:Transcript_2500/g.8898  ORF Transcript_2500/g.8898 Transcript_2500/m.8898 type:complete len:261 (-) Transcript_2500:1181-1963(-)